MTEETATSGRERWQRTYDDSKKRDADFTTLSGLAVEPVYGPPDGAGRRQRVGWPGEFPFTRGLYPTGYRGKPWTIRQFSGFGNVRQTNERYKMLIETGGDGLSVAFDMPTLMGRDSDDPRSLGEVGHCGVAIDSAADMDVLFEGIRLDQTTTSMTISGPTPCRSSACTSSPPSARESTSEHAGRHPADRHLQGVHRAEGMALRP